MKIDPGDLRRRYQTFSTEALVAIVARSGEYTAEAQEIARGILAKRRWERPAPPEPAPTEAERREAVRWAGVSMLAGVAVHFAPEFFHAVRGMGLDGDQIVRATNAIEANPWTYVVAAVSVALVVRRRGGERHGGHRGSSRSGPTTG